MAQKYDATNPEHFALFRLTDRQLALRGITGADLEALRATQYATPPATSVEDLAEQQRVAAKQSPKSEKKAD